MDRSTNMRLRAQQSCPVLANTLMGEVSAAFCQSASAKTIFGDLPPSSSEIRFTSREANSIIREPIDVEPVNDIFRIKGWVTSASPIAEPEPDKTCNTPAGNPAS